MSELAVPHIGVPIPPGWWRDVVLPVVEATDSWDALDDQESALKAYIAVVEQFDADVIEFQKALRCVERRRGDLLGPAVPGRPPANVPRVESLDVAPATANRWRTIARHWNDVVLPWLIVASSARDVTQAACLRMIEHGEPDPPRRNPELVRSYLDTALELLGQAWEERDWGLVASARVYVEKARG